MPEPSRLTPDHGFGLADDCERCAAFDAALSRLNSLYRGEPQEPSTEELAETVWPWLVKPTVRRHHRHDEITAAWDALSELVIRAQGHVPVEALAASEVAREQAAKERDEAVRIAQEATESVAAVWRLADRKAADDWRSTAVDKLPKAEAERDRLVAALEQIVAGRFNGPLHAIGIAREALNPGDGDERTRSDYEAFGG